MTEVFNQGMLNFLEASPTPFHATENIASELRDAGFEALSENAEWNLEPGGRYYVTRNDSSVIAFVKGLKPELETGIRMVGAHTDSPCLKVKPNADIYQKGYWQLGVEIYGGVLLAPWMDRDLSLAGRVTVLLQNGELKNILVNFEEAIATIPNLAIHLNRGVNDAFKLNPQLHLVPVLAQIDDEHKPTVVSLLKDYVAIHHSGLQVSDVLDYELCFYDTQAPAVIGLNKDFIVSARLDNLLSCYVGLESIINAGNEYSCLLVCNDHEEVGSASAVGAQGPMLETTLQRWLGSTDMVARVIDRSMMISVDNAHGVHPNYADKHDNNHGPLLNAGPVIKINSNQRYASNSETQAQFRDLCRQTDVPVQAFVTRSDMGCGSTIGPITATGIGVKTLDIGVPTFGMHSIRETAGSEDAANLVKVLQRFYTMSGRPGAL